MGIQRKKKNINEISSIYKILNLLPRPGMTIFFQSNRCKITATYFIYICTTFFTYLYQINETKIFKLYKLHVYCLLKHVNVRITCKIKINLTTCNNYLVKQSG